MIIVELDARDHRDTFHRKLTIERVEPAKVETLRDPAEKALYKVELSGGNQRHPIIFGQKTFEHRYGDDLLTLIAEAIDALGGRGGPYMGLRR